MSDSKFVPLMFQAQTKDRGKIQYAGGGEKGAKQPAEIWLNQWLQGCPPIPEAPQKGVPKWKQKSVNTAIKIPGFGRNVHVWEYTQKWRLVTNSGIDEGVIRPVIGAKGMPFYPGSSMKGAFLRACLQIAPEKVVDYCGGEVEEITDGKVQKRTKPGILRFHGGYPVDMSWGDINHKKRLLDIVHNQQERQVIKNINSSANVQISLYETKFKFGFSRNKSNRDVEVDWDLVKKIWERALSEGIGSRTSAGYGKFEKLKNENSIASFDLHGRGMTPTLLNGIEEFRPNIFKAALRGHTLRLLSGVTDEETTQRLTKELWGGFVQGNDGEGSVVGKFGIDFEEEDLEIDTHKYKPRSKEVSMPIYNLKSGKLDIIGVKSVSQKEEEFLTMLIKFSLLLGGFGKSWRRVNHKMFYPSYFDKNNKPMIGCHWCFSKPSRAHKYCITAPDEKLNNIKSFLSSIPENTRNYFNLPVVNNHVNNWREVWHPQKVQVWGRVADSRFNSKAVKWLHRDDFKESELAGKIGGRNPSQVSWVWHRMYPLYENIDGELKHKKNKKNKHKFVELLTIFIPDNSSTAEAFLNSLGSDGNDFERLWEDRGI